MITGLTPGKYLFYRAYAINEYGVGYSVNKVIAIDNEQDSIVETSSTEVSQDNKVNLSGKVVDSFDYTETGIVYSLHEKPTYADFAIPNQMENIYRLISVDLDDL